MLDRRRHKWFARYWNWQLRSENDQIIAMRREVASGAGGRVLEVGCGPGSNFRHYGPGLSQLIALDPNPHMLDIARTKTIARGKPVLVRGQVEALPFKDGAFATVVSTANFCSVRQPENGLAEIRRVLQPGGEYRFFDHVRSEDNRVLAFFQDAITPVHRRILGTGCRPNRRIGRLVAAASFGSVHTKMRKPLRVIPMAIYRPHVMGVARR